MNDPIPYHVRYSAVML